MANIYKISNTGISLCPIDDEMLDKRRIFIIGAVNSDSMNKLLKKLMYLDMKEPGKEITLYINSPGGECLSGLAVLDYIRTMRSPIRTVCIGTAASMGAILFLTGQKREMMAHTQLMIHDPSFGGGLGGMKPHEIEEQLCFLKDMQSSLVEIIASVTGKSVAEVEEVTKSDTFFTLEEALDFGLATDRYQGE